MMMTSCLLVRPAYLSDEVPLVGTYMTDDTSIFNYYFPTNIIKYPTTKSDYRTDRTRARARASRTVYTRERAVAVRIYTRQYAARRVAHGLLTRCLLPHLYRPISRLAVADFACRVARCALSVCDLHARGVRQGG